jgi:hypothetical protein
MPNMPTAALAHQSPSLQLLPVPNGPVAPYRPNLRVVEGGRSPERRAQRRTFRRRRATALALLATVVVAVVLLVGAASTRLAGGGHPSAAAGASSPTSAVALRAAEVAATSWVVAPGDTLWSIAAKIAPEADVRATVDRLVELNGKRPISVGQHLRLP